ncbi:protein of unknown function DUF1385 [Desulfocurvibacter africanus subsp. africanus str. Walvis Bay]|uniref:Metal-dependent enzyme n=2 Tax=Desulfocurvibacter africanus TaxID=873 RepID=F3YTY6_DESAF|nr:protein of unknown function DUF1385 [Desulfocurvibacter africanus subsp. africanus str. Walvis Bay]
MPKVLSALLTAATTVGGQAVMEGVMMRSRDRLAIAVRKQSGEILVEIRPWFSLTTHPWLRKPFIRGFPVLLETLINGIKALNFSARVAMEEDEGGEVGSWALAGTLLLSIALAVGLFVVLPHLFSLLMKWWGLSGDVNSLSFHAWDGLFKFALFLGYVASISLLPDIRRVFQYHGAEHKAIWAYEQGVELIPQTVRGYSRLHPRCGTAFLLFVLALSIVLFAVLVPLAMAVYAPSGPVLKQAYVILVKLLLMVPVSSMAYELIRMAGRFHENIVCKLMSCPGMMLQFLTTFEPDDSHLEVAIAALQGAVEGNRQPCSPS